MNNKTEWNWYHWLISYIIIIFLTLLYSGLIVLPWYSIWKEYSDLKNGVPVLARYESSEPLVTDSKHDYEKEYKYNYSFESPNSKEKLYYSVLGVGKDNHPGEEIQIYYNQETGVAGHPEFWAICFGNWKLLLLSLSTFLWVFSIHLAPKLKNKK